jgi:tetratricopeptide (TPR) repeat protein
MNNGLRWVLPIPFLLFAGAVWLFVEMENETRVQVLRAQKQWREEHYMEAIEIYESVYENYPKSQYADDALWEIGTIYYVNFYNVDRALLYYRQLVSQYPDSSLAADAYLRLAEIYEVELTDLPQAIAYWSQILIREVPREMRRQVNFKMGNAYFKLNQFEEAAEKFQLLMEDGSNDQLAERARARAGTILQIQSQFEKSVDYFKKVLEGPECADCRRTARLGLIESYEFLGELAKAIEVAKTIPTSEYPTKDKEDLLKRLENKARYY